MKIINIGGKDYTFEFSIEASLYSDCTESVMEFMFDVGNAQTEQDTKKLLETMTNIPHTAMTLFYAGLKEHHSMEVPNELVAKQLVKTHIKENNANFYSIIKDMLECMGDDGFFNLIGLTEMMSTEEAEVKQPKQPQDHKKKATKK